MMHVFCLSTSGSKPVLRQHLKPITVEDQESLIDLRKNVAKKEG